MSNGTTGSNTTIDLEVDNPTPVISFMSVSTALAGSASAVITFFGAGFDPSTVIDVNGSARTTTFINSTQVSAALPSSDFSAAGNLSITAVNPAPAGGTSSAITLSVVNAPVPTLTSIYPSGGPIGTVSPETLTGTGFTANTTVAVNGQTIPSAYISSTEITTTFPADLLATPGNQNVTVTTPAPGGGTSATQTYTTFIFIPNNDIVYNAADGLIYASVPATAPGAIGNAVVGIDPNTGAITRQIQVGTTPNKLALSADGTQLFVGIDGAGAVAQINLANGTVVNQFSLGGGSGGYDTPYTAAYMAAVPGLPNSVAVATTREYGNGANVTIFDSGIPRTVSTVNIGEGPLSFGSSASTLYTASSSVYMLTVGPTGITGSSALDPISSTLTWLQYDNGSLYLSNGQVLDATTGALKGTFYTATNTPANGPIVSDSTLGKAFMAVSNYMNTAEVYIFDETSFNLLGSIPVNDLGAAGYPTNFIKIVRWGQNGLAVSTVPSAFTSNNQIYIFQSALVKDVSSSPADLSVSLTAPSTGSTGATVTYVATVTNNGPNSAVSATLSVGLDPSLIINSVTASQGSCTTATSFSCDLGGLANGTSVTVTVNATPTNSGTLASTAIVSSSSYDPNSSNNQANASTVVTGNLYSPVPFISTISPNLVQAGSAAFTLSVNGTGFTDASTVNVGGTAIATTYVSSTQLTANVPASAIANYGWASITVSSPSPGGGVSPVAPLTIYAVVNVPANNILFDPYGQLLYATVPSSATGITGNSVVAVNPFTGAVGTPVSVGSQPTVMAESGDGNDLYISLSGANSLAQYDLIHQRLVQSITFSGAPSSYSTAPVATALAVMPGVDTTLAVDFSGTDGIMDITGSIGQFRPNFASEDFPNFDSATELYTYDNMNLYRYSINASGFTLLARVYRLKPIEAGFPHAKILS